MSSYNSFKIGMTQMMLFLSETLNHNTHIKKWLMKNCCNWKKNEKWNYFVTYNEIYIRKILLYSYFQYYGKTQVLLSKIGNQNRLHENNETDRDGQK